MLEQKDLELIAQVVKQAIEPTNKKIDNIEAKVQNIETRIGNIETRVENIENRVENIENRVENVELKVRDIQLTLENEVNPKINVIAEGHSILNRKLDDGLVIISQVANSHEMFQLKQIFLESELIKIKETLSGFNIKAETKRA